MNKLISQLQSSNPKIAWRAEKKLIKSPDSKYVAPLLALHFSGPRADIILSRYPDYGLINKLLIRRFKTTKRKYARAEAVSGLNDFPDKSSVPFLKKLAGNQTNLGFKTVALYALSKILTSEAPEIEDDVYKLFVDAINDKAVQIRSAGFTGLVHMRHHDTRKLLARAFKDPDYLTRCNASNWENMRRGMYSGTKKV